MQPLVGAKSSCRAYLFPVCTRVRRPFFCNGRDSAMAPVDGGGADITISLQ